MQRINALLRAGLFLLAGFLLFNAPTQAQPSLPYCFSDHMVLQRGQAIPVWGWAPPGGTVTVTLAGQNVSAQADKQGRWKAQLPAMEAGGPYELKVADEQFSISFTDVLVGEVWICSGQSNMEFPVQQANNAAEEVAQADFPQIRLLTVPRNMANLPQKNILAAAWEVCQPATVNDFSAVGVVETISGSDRPDRCVLGRHRSRNLDELRCLCGRLPDGAGGQIPARYQPARHDG